MTFERLRRVFVLGIITLLLWPSALRVVQASPASCHEPAACRTVQVHGGDCCCQALPLERSDAGTTLASDTERDRTGILVNTTLPMVIHDDAHAVLARAAASPTLTFHAHSAVLRI